MEQKGRVPYEIRQETLQNTIYMAGEPLLSYEITFPYLWGAGHVGERMRQDTLLWAKKRAERIRRSWLPMAQRQYRILRPTGYFEPLRIGTSYDVMLQEGELFSFFVDLDCDLRHDGRFCLRTAKTYSLRDGNMLTLDRLFHRSSAWQRPLLEQLQQQIARQAAEDSAYFADWRQRYRSLLDSRRFYLTDGGIVIFFPEESIASRNGGIPSFRVPCDALRHLLVWSF